MNADPMFAFRHGLLPHLDSSEGVRGTRRVLLVGNPNVGKSALFNALTGLHTTVSNYPGTTVEVARGSFASPRGSRRGGRLARGELAPPPDARTSA